MSGLLLETRKAEADHAEIQHKIDELVCQYDAQEQQALADVDEGSRAIDAQFEKQLAGIAGIEPSLRQSMEAVLKKNRDLEIAALRQTFQERAKQRRKHYDEQRQRYDTELFTAITALITAGVSDCCPAYFGLLLIVPARSEPKSSAGISGRAVRCLSNNSSGGCYLSSIHFH